MQRDDMPERDQGGLSTEDLARPQEEKLIEDRRDKSASAHGQEMASSPPERGTVAGAVPGDRTQHASAERSRAEPATEETGPLLQPPEAEAFRSKWHQIQAEFVDDPQDAVHAADRLVAEVMQSLATTFASHKKDLEGQWQRGEEVATEDLRLALQHYRSFCNRLLTT